MKQRRIKELTINHYEQGSSVAYTPSRTEEYAPVLAQAEAHQDLRFHATSNSVENIVILPWESVIGVYATYETADVTAPTDAICGGEEAGRFVVKPQEPIPPAVKRGEQGNCSISVPTFIPVMTFDGQPLSTEDFVSGGGTFAVEGATHVSELNIDYLPVDCDATSATYTTTFTYQGESCDVTVTQQIDTGTDG